MDRLNRNDPPPAYKPGLRPLRLVEMQQARRGVIPQRGSSLRRDSLLRPLPEPEPALTQPQQAPEPHWPSPDEMARMSSWRSVDTLWEAPEDVDAPARPFTPVVPTASRQSVHYDVNDWLHRSRAARAQQELLPVPHVPLQRAQTAPPAPIEPRSSELPYLRSPSPAGSLPVPPRPAARRQPTVQEQHEMAVEALRAQGSWLPDIMQQARRGHVLTVPPYLNEAGQLRRVAQRGQADGRPSPGTELASHPRGR